MNDFASDAAARLFGMTLEEVNERLRQEGHPNVSMVALSALVTSGVIDRRVLRTPDEEIFDQMPPSDKERVRYLEACGDPFAVAVRRVQLGFRMPFEGGPSRVYPQVEAPLATYVFPPVKPARGPKLTRAQRKAQKARK